MKGNRNSSVVQFNIAKFRRIQEMTVQYETTTQQMRERMLSGAGSSDDVKRENTQLRTQVCKFEGIVQICYNILYSWDRYKRSFVH